MHKKYIVMLLNKNEFIEHKFGEETMRRESFLHFTKLTPIVPTRFVFTVSRSIMRMNDSLWGLDFIFRREENGFRYEFEKGQENNLGSRV